MAYCSFHLELHGRGHDLCLALPWKPGPAGPWVEVTCEGLGVNENPLDRLTIFLAQLQIDFIGAVGLGPGSHGEKEDKFVCV